jgi:exodeoxyribonuclease-3
MKILTYNVNGIRAALKKDFIGLLARVKPDVVCLQEIKATEDQIPLESFEALGYHCYWYSAQKKGYSGVAILSKIKPTEVTMGCGHELFDFEGRVITAIIGDYTIVSAYFPSGTTGDARQTVKYEFLDYFYKWALEQKERNPNLVVCGDYNICHKAIDIHNPISNKNSSGFLPEERAWMDKWFESGFVDTFRAFNADPHQYTWWSYRANARANNKGWRIDYISTTDRIEIVGSGALQQDFQSDHCGSWVEVKS